MTSKGLSCNQNGEAVFFHDGMEKLIIYGKVKKMIGCFPLIPIIRRQE